MIVKIPFKTPSINHLYGQRGFRKFLTKEAKELRETINDIIYKQKGILLMNVPLSISVEIHENWYTQKKEVARKDISNREKFLVDSIFDALEIDDKYIFEHTMKKIQDQEEFAIIKIEEIK